MKKYTPNFIPTKLEVHHDYVVYRDVRIPMRDGVELSTNIFFPAKGGVVDFSKKYPILMNRTGYMTSMGELGTAPMHLAYFANELGYAFVINASRGTYLSGGGEMRPLMDEGWAEHPDGVDTVNWLAQQSWSNGKVATCGVSWLGNTQYSIWLADEVPDAMVTSAIQCPAMNSIDGGWVYKDEFLDLGCCPAWAFLTTPDQCIHKHLPEDTIAAIMKENGELGNPFENPMVSASLNYAELQATYGLANIPAIRHAPFYQRWLANRDNPEFFRYNDTRTRKHDAKRPLLFIASWYDLFNENALTGYMRMVAEAPSEEVAKEHRLIVGPWAHTPNIMYRQYPESFTDQRLLVMEWTQQQVNGVPSKFFAENPVTLFVQGENRWRGEQSWPLPDAEVKKLYLHSGGPANTMLGGGTLSEVIPGKDEAPDCYMSDPSNYIKIGGGHSLTGGQADQRAAETRSDVLCYTSPELEEDMEVTGYVRATLYAATSATDTDFFMKIVDVCPDGNCYNVLTGGRRGRYLKHGRSNPTALTPGEINEYQIELHSTSYVFKKGHKIRVDICSTDAGNFDINPNAFIDLNTATRADYVVAAQTVYHDADHPAVIELPVIPATHQRNWIELPFHSSYSGVDSVLSGLNPLMGANDPVFLAGKDLPTTGQKDLTKA